MDHRNLITFIPETRVSAHQSLKSKTRFLDTQSHDGEEVKAFYENLITHKCSGVEKSHVKLEPEGESEYTKHNCHKSNRKSDSESLHSRRHNKKKCHSKSNINASCSSETPQQLHTSTDGKRFKSFNSHGSNHFYDNFPTPLHRDQFKLLQYAQLGDDENIKELLTKINNLDLNFKDFYGWTALMCAAKEGHIRVIEILLDYGSDRTLKNSSGDTAAKIARNEGYHGAIVSMLDCESDNYSSKKKKSKKRKKEDISSFGTFTCDSCQSEFSISEKESHYTSTVHLFNNKSKMKISSYFIPNSNRGFQMLLRSGWSADSGLGPDGQGRMYPIKTVLKQDRVGLGGDEQLKKKAKVTHFSGGDTEAVNYQKKNAKCEVSVRKAARNAAKLKEKRERRWEQNLRFEMNSDSL